MSSTSDDVSHHVSHHVGHHVSHDGTPVTGGFGCVEVINGARRRRDWSVEEKLAIIAESFATRSSISEVARRVSGGQVGQSGGDERVRAGGGIGRRTGKAVNAGRSMAGRRGRRRRHRRDRRFDDGADSAGGRRADAAAGSRRGEDAGMISVPPGVRTLVATAPVDFRRGMDSLAMLVQQAQGCSPYSGNLHVFRSNRSARARLSSAIP